MHLAVHWDLPHLTCVFGHAEDVAKITRVERHVVPEGMREGEIPEWFQRQRGDTPVHSVSFVIPRDRLVLSRVDVPNDSDAMLPPIVAMQLAARLTSEPGELVVDFLPPQRRENAEIASVLAAALPQRTLEILQTTSRLLGCDEPSIHVAPVVAIELLTRVAKTPAFPVVPAAIFGSRAAVATIELVDGRIYDAKARRTETVNSTRASELRRLQLTSSDAEPNPWVIDASTVDDGTTIHLSDLPVCFDVAEDETVDFDVLSAAASLLATTNASQPQIDFGSPRQAAPPVNRKRQLTFAAVAAGLLAITWVGLSIWSQVADVDDQIELASEKLRNAVEVVDTFGQRRAERAVIEQHLAGHPDIAQLFETLLTAMPGRDEMVLVDYSVTPMTGQTIARIRGSGFANGRRTVERFTEQLAVDGARVRPATVNVSDKRSGYTHEFNFELDLTIERSESRPQRRSPTGRT